MRRVTTTEDELKPPPFSQRDEEYVLRAVLREPDKFDDVRAILGAEAFYLDAHQAIFRAVERLVAAGRGLDRYALQDELVGAGALANVGGPEKIECLYNPAVFVGPVAGHAHRVRDFARKRDLLHALRASLREVEGSAGRLNPVEELAAAAEQRIFEATSGAAGPSKLYPVGTIIREGLAAIDARRQGGGPPGINSGYPDLDEVLVGLRPGQLVMVGGRPSSHKTNFSMNLAVNAAVEGHPTLFVSLEMSRAELADRLLAMGSGVPVRDFTHADRLDGRDLDSLVAVGGPGGIGGLPIFVHEDVDVGVAEVASVVRRAIRKHKIELVVVDYLQLLRPENPKDQRYLQVGTMTKRLKQLAQQVRVPVVVLAQLNRESERREGGRPKLSDFRESGDVEAHADVALLTHVPADQPENAAVHDLEVLVAKNRNGRRDALVTLALKRSTFTIESKARGY